ncbi:MAG: Ig-like domain-containing protein [candidate division FCPU426 bacterium]
MMKKLLSGLAVVGLAAGAALYLSSCAQQAGPLNPDLKVLNSNSTTTEKTMPQIVTTPPMPVLPISVSQTAQISFTKPMNPSTISASTILVYQQSADGLSENLLNYTVTYNAAAQQATITPNGGVWTNDSRYHIVITTACQSVTGNQLDGNGNGIPEDPTFDNTHLLFTLGTPPTNYVDPRGYIRTYSSLTVTAGAVTAYLTPGGYVGGLAAVYNYVTITVGFDFTYIGYVDPNFAIDQSSVFQDATTLNPNINITDANGTRLTPANVTLSGAQNQTLTIELALQPASKYYITLKGGYNGIRTSSAANAAVTKGLLFDGNFANGAEASDDWKTATIMTANVDNSAMPSLAVNGVFYNSTLRRVYIQFQVPPGVGTGTLNPSTVNNNTIILIDENDTDVAGDEPDKPIVPVSIELNNTLPPVPEVYVWVPEKFSQDSSNNHDHTVRVVIKGVQSAEGVGMDTNADGVIGSPADVYSTTVTIENHQ